MTDSVFSSPARSWRDVGNYSQADSDNELSDSFDQCYLPLSEKDKQESEKTVVSGWLKFRDLKRVRLFLRIFIFCLVIIGENSFRFQFRKINFKIAAGLINN